jgi:hypothetical protein
MGGSGGGGYSGSSDVSRDRREAQELLKRQERDAEINEYLGEQLATVNDRDIPGTNRRLDAIEEALDSEALEVDRLLFGGSVAKHTYVDGLSDVDALVVVNEPEATPNDLIHRFAESLRARLPAGDFETVEEGRLAVTITYADGSQVQLLPAVERAGHTSIASEDGSQWRQIKPHKFAEKLTQVNKDNGQAVVPTIKLAKALIADVDGDHKISGYHMEAIAVDAFKEYNGRRDRASMLQHLISHASEAVLRPTGDITGQSVNIDDHLGGAGSSQRLAISADLRRVANALESASGADDVRTLLGD